MQIVILGIFLVLHGLVHLLYAGQSRRLFELRPGMVWPDGSWAFSRLLGDEPARLLVSILLAVATLGLVTGGLGLFLKQDWWRIAAVGAAVFSTVLFILAWDGKLQALDDQGGVGVLINVAIVGIALWLK